jgi:DNA-binding winged helix-turn-helix (wHTH) protein
MDQNNLPFGKLADRILHDLSRGRSTAVTGLSNSGKSTLMRALASESAALISLASSGAPSRMIYIDCNQAVAVSAQAFYEIVLRSVLERITDLSGSDLAATIQKHHQAVTEAETDFSASLSFNLALTDLCEQMGMNLTLLLDEFDEIYATLDDRALLNLRALHDRFQDRLTYVTATVRSLPEIRGQSIEGEFAELFSHAKYPMPLLAPKEAETLIDELGLPGLNTERKAFCLQMSGNHPGLLNAVAQLISKIDEDWVGDISQIVMREPQPRAECLKIWGQLTSTEQAQLMSISVDSDSRLAPHDRFHLEGLALLRDDKIFSPIMERFIARRGRGAVELEAGVHLDADSGDVWVDGIRIPVLTDLEFRLLKLLYERRDKISDKHRIVTAVWGEAYLGEVDDARVEKLISRLRSKIEADPSEPRYLITQRGRGYKLLSRPRLHGLAQTVSK